MLLACCMGRPHVCDCPYRAPIAHYCTQAISSVISAVTDAAQSRNAVSKDPHGPDLLRTKPWCDRRITGIINQISATGLRAVERHINFIKRTTSAGAGHQGGVRCCSHLAVQALELAGIDHVASLASRVYAWAAARIVASEPAVRFDRSCSYIQ